MIPRSVPLRVHIILNAIMIINIVGSVRKPWYFKLPDEHLNGVPRYILEFEKYGKRFKEWLGNASGLVGDDRDHIQMTRNLQFTQRLVKESVPFPCPLNDTRSSSKPRNVHTIRPGDIDVIAALGDSLTAGLGALALNVRQMFNENRGVTAFIGGQDTWRQFTTLPNILKEFNSELTGYSYADTWSHGKEARFNMAESAAMSQDLFHMTKILVGKIKNDSNVNFQNDWKLVTLFIGTNNHCTDLCYVANLNDSARNHKKDLLNIFRYLRDNMPRTIINFMQTLGMEYLKRDRFPDKCRFWHLLECSCLFGRPNEKKLPLYMNIIREWQEVDQEINLMEEFRNRDDFAILLQPILTNLVLPTKYDPITRKKIVDTTYFSPDCFHYSQKLNQNFGIAAWNSLITPDGSKSSNAFHVARKYRCPTREHPYIYTWKNSRS